MAAEIRRFSRTALAVAAHRAVHQHRDGEPRILDDPISGQLLGPDVLERLLSAGGGLDWIRLTVAILCSLLTLVLLSAVWRVSRWQIPREAEELSGEGAA